jgi:hypothetical protein
LLTSDGFSVFLLFEIGRFLLLLLDGGAFFLGFGGREAV